jgi:FemAB-related protein (PEP-CTERM system-associated)
MTSVRSFAEADGARWDDYVLHAPGSHFGQLTAWKRVQERAYGVRARWWIAERAGAIAGVLPLFETRGAGGGRRLFSAPGGLLADDEEAAHALLEPARAAVQREGHAWLELRDQRRRWEELLTEDEHVTMEVELPRDPEVLWKAFDAKLRNQIRKGERAGFTARWGREHVAAFYRVLLENMRDLGTPILGEDYYRQVLDGFGDDATVLVLEAAGEPAGAMFLVEHAGTLADPWASSLRRFLSRCPNQVLYWEALQRGIARGCSRFDFGRSQWGSGTFQFKEQWLAKPVPLFYQYVLGKAPRAPTIEDQKHAFGLAVTMWRRLPVPVAGALGRRVKRLFPEAL